MKDTRGTALPPARGHLCEKDLRGKYLDDHAASVVAPARAPTPSRREKKGGRQV